MHLPNEVPVTFSDLLHMRRVIDDMLEDEQHFNSDCDRDESEDSFALYELSDILDQYINDFKD